MGSSPLKRQFARLVGTPYREQTAGELVPGSTVVGFEVVHSQPPRELRLEGRHRFSRYALTFEIEDRNRTILRAITDADFPGLKGQIYKTLVIRTRGHVLAARLILGAVKRRAERVSQADGAR